ncbi:response regulator transcription factor [Pontibacillus litoralis]|uniref:XRE family transcriptional regulator n=1 Tax=Pontibacillus litoralis JSM 072002 TaxID=1385512 RepID=A0A0A5HTV0_9BACI|nr:response regulator transcription factor [Pontibacillus litoralis]KGX87022.1 XRE family transcriptional regulator [Pontibacillus litoralis JSM 072002]
MSHLLVVDDEQRMLDLLELYVMPYGYTCTKVHSGQEALNKLNEESFDLVLLDIMMAHMDGWETCMRIREKSDIPIMMVTALEHKADVVKGLRMGADDYVTKPFDEEELLARIEALLRRTSKDETLINRDGLLWDGDTHELRYEQLSIPLTPKEFNMIGLLMKNPGRVYSREQLIELVWDIHSETEGRTVDSHVRNLRDKVRQVGFPIDDFLKTVWGVGYKWERNA